MKKCTFLLIFYALSNAVQAQAANPDITAKTFMHQGDYANAVIVLNKALQQTPNDIEMQKDLAQSWYFQENYDKALEVIKPVLDNENADDQAFIIAGSIYRQRGEAADEEKTYRRGLKKFPTSGLLYNMLGEAQLSGKNPDAIKTWEKGIELDPSYSRNYSNAALFYAANKNATRAVLYGEIFVNMEPNSSKTADIKQVVFDGYRSIFTASALDKSSRDKASFDTIFLSVLNKSSDAALSGITPATLTAIRTKFILLWFSDADRPAFKLFELQQELIREGLFDAYDEWLFGPPEDAAAYQSWLSTHAAENKSFSAFQRNRVFRIPAGQYYY